MKLLMALMETRAVVVGRLLEKLPHKLRIGVITLVLANLSLVLFSGIPFSFYSEIG